MSISSMTGYGRGETLSGGVSVVVELSSVNRKQFDLRLNIPRSLAALESQISKIVHGQVSRGCVTGSIRVAVDGKARSGGISVSHLWRNQFPGSRACLARAPTPTRPPGIRQLPPEQSGFSSLLQPGSRQYTSAKACHRKTTPDRTQLSQATQTGAHHR